jgi:hypothetical protein
MHTPHRQPALAADWLSFCARPWVAGPVDAFLGNSQLARMMAQHAELQDRVDGFVATLDLAMVGLAVGTVRALAAAHNG